MPLEGVTRFAEDSRADPLFDLEGRDQCLVPMIDETAGPLVSPGGIRRGDRVSLSELHLKSCPHLPGFLQDAPGVHSTCRPDALGPPLDPQAQLLGREKRVEEPVPELTSLLVRGTDGGPLTGLLAQPQALTQGTALEVRGQRLRPASVLGQSGGPQALHPPARDREGRVLPRSPRAPRRFALGREKAPIELAEALCGLRGTEIRARSLQFGQVVQQVRGRRLEGGARLLQGWVFGMELRHGRQIFLPRGPVGLPFRGFLG